MAAEILTTLGALFRNRRERGRAGLPLLSVTMGNGLVRRDSLDRKTETELSDEEHLLVRKGDFAYNMMRMWQGAFGLSDEDGLVSPAYVVLAPTEDVDPLFVSHFFRTPRMLYLFWAYSYGLTDDRLRLYFKEFSRIRVRIPGVEQQRRFGLLLSTWDNQIDLVRRRLRTTKLLKQGLVQRLLRGTAREPVAQGSPLDVCELGELFRERAENNRPDLPLLSVTADRGVVPRSGSEGESPNGDLSNYKRVAPGDIAYNTMRMWQGVSGLADREGIVSPAYTVCIPTQRIDGRFAGYMLKYPPIVHQLYRYSQGLVDDTRNLKFSHFARISIAIPSVPQQRSIAAILCTVDKEIGLLQRYENALDLQKRALMQQVFGKSQNV